MHQEHEAWRGTEGDVMRRLPFVPLSVIAVLVGFGLSAVGQSHAQGLTSLQAREPASTPWCIGAFVCYPRATDPAGPITITQWWASTGMATDVPAAGHIIWQGVDHGQLAAGSTFTDSAHGQRVAGNTFTDTLTFTSDLSKANGCATQVYHFTRTFATRGDSYTYAARGLSCPMAGHRGQTESAGTLVITGGTGEYKGASGTGTYTYIATMARNKAGRPRELLTTARGKMKIILAFL
jgi:hypothetical protein